MVCHRWNLALILLTVPLLVTVISAFRVRLTGTSNEVKSDLRRHKCVDCDVREKLNNYDDIRKVLKDKRNLIDEKFSKSSVDTHNDSQEASDGEDDNVLENSVLNNLKVKPDSSVKVKSKKPSLVLDFFDDDDSEMEDDDEYDKTRPKVANQESDTKKKELPTPTIDVKISVKSKPKIEKDKSASDVNAQSKKVLPQDVKYKILPHKEIVKDNLQYKDKPLKLVKVEIDEKDKKTKLNELILETEQPKTENKIKDTITKEKKNIRPVLEKKVVSEDTLLKVKKTENIEKKLTSFRDESVKKTKENKSPEVLEVSKIMDDEEVKENLTKNSSKDVRVQHFSSAILRRNVIQSEFEDYYTFLPTFAPNFSRIHNPECRRHGQILLRQLRGSKLWALNMLDATAKIPSGLLQGNGIQLGDFDQCLGVRARVQLDTGSIVKIQGKYCLAMIDVKAEQPELEAPVYLAQARNLFKSRIDDPGHFVPRFSTLSWGVCVPSPCGPEDVEVVLRDAIKHYQYRVGISVRVKVDGDDCHVKKGPNWWNEWLELPTLLTMSLYMIVIILVLTATLQDFLARNVSEQGKDEEEDEEQNETEDIKKPGILNSFSLYNTLAKLVAPVSKDEIGCIHGLRAIATLALLIAHKFLPIGLTPYTNRIKLSEVVSSPLLSWCRAGWMFTDCFFLLSGTLTSFRKTHNDTLASKLIHRYFRLTPALAAIVFFYAYVWDNISSGPMWGTLVTKNVELCQKGWWRNLLYIQNYDGFENMCAPQTHHMALDFQLTILGGVIVWAIQYEVPFSSLVMPILHLSSAYLRYTTFRDHHLTVLAYQGVSVSQLYRTGRLSYTSVFHRCTPYLVGISLGLALRNPSHLSKVLKIVGWFTCGLVLALVLWAGADSGYLEYRYDVTFSALYGTFAPIATALVFAWFIYAAHNSQSAIVSRLLCCRLLLFISRISYALYLIQFIVYLTNTASIRAAKEFSFISIFDFEEILSILFWSILLTITLVIPLQSLPKISFMIDTVENKERVEETDKSESLHNKNETEKKLNSDNHTKEVPQMKIPLIAHREVLEEISEIEMEYEMQRDAHDVLEEILEEDDALEEEHQRLDEDDLEIIEEEQGEDELQDDFWTNRQEYLRRSFSNNQDGDEWEWTANGSQN